MYVMEPQLRPELLVLGAVGIAADEYLEAWATRRTAEVGSTSRLMHMFVWIAHGRWMVAALTVMFTALGRIEAESCALIFGFEFGYSLGEVEGWTDRIARQLAVAFQHE